MLTLQSDDLRQAILQVLEHDRWNSNLPDERIAEKVVAILEGQLSDEDA